MKLPGANLVNATLDGVTYKSVREFLNKLIKTRNLVADIYVNTHLLMSCHVSTYVTNGYIIASVDGRFRLTKEEILNNLIIHVRQANSDENIFELVTLASGIIPHVDIDADINFCIGSVFPNNTSKLNIPNTGFKPLFTNKLPEIDLDAQPSVNPDVIVVNGITFYLNDALNTATFNADISGNYNLISWNVSADGESYESSTSGNTLEITSLDAIELIAKLNAIEVGGKCDVGLSFDDGELTSYQATKISTPVPPGPGPEPELEEGEFESGTFNVAAGPKKARGQWPLTGTAQLTVEAAKVGNIINGRLYDGNMANVKIVALGSTVLMLLNIGATQYQFEKDYSSGTPEFVTAEDLNSLEDQSYHEGIITQWVIFSGKIPFSSIPDLSSQSTDVVDIQLSGGVPARAYSIINTSNYTYAVVAAENGSVGNKYKVEIEDNSVDDYDKSALVSLYENNVLVGTSNIAHHGSLYENDLNELTINSVPITNYVHFYGNPSAYDLPLTFDLSGGADL